MQTQMMRSLPRGAQLAPYLRVNVDSGGAHRQGHIEGTLRGMARYNQRVKQVMVSTNLAGTVYGLSPQAYRPQYFSK
jgi:hypothetical protein